MTVRRGFLDYLLDMISNLLECLQHLLKRVTSPS